MIGDGRSVNCRLGRLRRRTLNGTVVDDAQNQRITHTHDLICDTCIGTLLVDKCG